MSKAIDKAAGKERRVIGEYFWPDGKPRNTPEHQTTRNGIYSDIKTDDSPNDRSITAPATDAARQWEGWGTALKPAWEPIILARKPLEGTVAANVTKWGCGCINIDKCRVKSYNNQYDTSNRGGGEGGGIKENAGRISLDELRGMPEADNALEMPNQESETPDDLFNGMSVKTNERAEQSVMAGRSMELFPLGISDAKDGHPPRIGQSLVVESEYAGDIGASPCHGTETRQATPGNGNGASHKRNKVGQSDRESLSIRMDESRKRTPQNNAGAGPTSGGESRIEETPRNITAPAGRWPANLIHDGSEEVLELFPETKSGEKLCGQGSHPGAIGPIGLRGKANLNHFASDSGSAARFFYCAKASRAEREMGCEGMEERDCTSKQNNSQLCYDNRSPNGNTGERPPEPMAKNHHPTVKPLALMRYLCRLVTPPNGIILDPFMGSGTTGMAAQLEGFRFIGIEKEKEYVDIAERRIEAIMPRGR